MLWSVMVRRKSHRTLHDKASHCSSWSRATVTAKALSTRICVSSFPSFPLNKRPDVVRIRGKSLGPSGEEVVRTLHGDGNKGADGTVGESKEEPAAPSSLVDWG